MPPNRSTRTGNSTEKRDGVDMVGAIPDNLTGQIAAATAKPVRGVVLEFAPKLPTTRRKEVLLNA
jgi:hypothetical protein